uniref:Uncharacterized protein n=1 Tax=viral metagenome TaxID=1070528 RepID=A0A6M3K4X1_9ZZZZ
MTTLKDLSLELTEFHDVPVPQLQRQLLLGLQELCKETWAYVEDLAMTTVASTAEHTLTPSNASTKVCGVKEATYTDSDSKKHDIPITNRENMNTESSTWQTTTSSDTSIEYIIYDGGTIIRLDKIPTAGGLAFTVRVALYPTADITFPGVLERHTEAVKDFARWKLFALPQAVAPWANPQLAEYHRQQWVSGMLSLKRKRGIGYGGARRVRMRWWC